MTEHLNVFSAFIRQTNFDHIPSEIIFRAKLIIADCIGAIIGGSAEPEMLAFVDSINSPGKSRILGNSKVTDPQTASLINGTAGTVLEMDEGHQFARGHPGMHVLPALLAASENALHPVSGKDFLKSFIIGYDIAARVGLSTSLHPNMHPHGTWGVVGAAASLGSLNQLDEVQLSELINIASSLTLATSRKTMVEGGTVRNAYTGVANQMAHIAYGLLIAGFSGEKDGLRSVFGGVVSSCFDVDAALDKIGERFEVSRNYFKLHACCRYNHAALDAVWMLIDRHSELRYPEEISCILVESYFLAAELDDQKPHNALAARFSIPFAIATTLVNRSSKVLSFTGSALSNPAILALAAKTTVKENSHMSAKLPDLRPALVNITMKNGSSFRAEVETNRGDWQDPYDSAQLKDKYMSLTTRCWSDQESEEVYKNLMIMDEFSHVTKVFDT
ncbi:MAG: MmgE/PrpD family protein [Paracoccaceae bacterium]|nr:MmgE/PrpD family protein [Paracoccaceae bacterium]